MVTIGNVMILKKNLEDQGFDVSLDKKTLNDEVSLDDYVFIYMGSGTNRSLLRVLKDARKYKEAFKKFIDDKKIILATGNSFEIFGKKIDNEEGLNIFDYEVKLEKDNENSDVIYESKYLKKEVVGFINKRKQNVSQYESFF